jgi:hypothetical protein
MAGLIEQKSEVLISCLLMSIFIVDVIALPRQEDISPSLAEKQALVPRLGTDVSYGLPTGTFSDRRVLDAPSRGFVIFALQSRPVQALSSSSSPFGMPSAQDLR